MQPHLLPLPVARIVLVAVATGKHLPEAADLAAARAQLLQRPLAHGPNQAEGVADAVRRAIFEIGHPKSPFHPLDAVDCDQILKKTTTTPKRLKLGVTRLVPQPQRPLNVVFFIYVFKGARTCRLLAGWRLVYPDTIRDIP